MTNETKHTADARPWHTATHPENSEIKYIRFDNGEFHKEVCVLYSYNSKANAAHIVKCVNAHDDLVELLHVILMQHRTDGAYSSKGEVVLSPAMERAVEAALKKASE